MWRMLHDKNAIEAMAITIRYAEPVGSFLAKKILGAVDTPASKAGLIDKRPVHGFQINMSNPSEVRPMASGAMIYQKVSLEKDRLGQVQSVLTKQIDAQPTHITYQTWRYNKWEDELDAAMDILEPALKAAAHGVAIGAVRLEYLDRFYFDGEASEASPTEILNVSSNMLASHLFSAPDLWHSHTGKFSDVSQEKKRLVVVNADFQDLTGPDPAMNGKRSLLLTTAAENQYGNSGFEVSSEPVKDFLSSVLTDLHADAITLFKDVVSNNFRSKQGLPHD